VRFTATVATFHDRLNHGGQPDPGSEFQAAIDWGDGTSLDTGQVQPVAPTRLPGGRQPQVAEDTVTPYPSPSPSAMRPR